MSGMLYYYRGIVGKPSDENLKSCGLSGQAVKTVRGVEDFADHSQGSIFTINGKCDNDLEVGFYPDRQEWMDIPDTKLSIGYDTKNRPVPNDFLKKDYIDGHKVKLGDEHEWTIPLARKFQEGCVLPKTHMMIKAGELVEVPVKKYVKLGDLADKLQGLLPALFGKESKGDLSFISTDLKIFNVCVEILQTNYNLDFREISILQLLNSDNRIKILTSVVDAQSIEKWMSEELEKKKD